LQNSFSELTAGLKHILPFGTFLVLTGLTPLIPGGVVWIYPLKTCLVGFLLLWFWHAYPEIQVRRVLKPIPILFTLIIGIGVFAIWILPDLLGWHYPRLGESSGFNPYEKLGSRRWAIVWIGFRLLGAAVVVPVMEELFWRSFLLRYLIHPNFKQVSIGAFSWLSFGATVLLFGVEHNRWLVGMVAGILYNLLLYRTKSVFVCILAHAITNLALGVYVLMTHQWMYW